MFNRLKALFAGQSDKLSLTENSFTIENFADEFLLILREIKSTGNFSYNKKTQTIIADENDDLQIYLGNLFNKTKLMDKDERSLQIEMFIKESQNLENISEQLLDEKLFYRVRTESEISIRKLYLGNSNSKLKDSLDVTNGELRLEFVIDQENTIRVPTHEDIQSLGTSTTDALTIAHRNMKSITNKDNWINIEKNIWQSNYEDDYDAARLVSLYPEMELPFSGLAIAFMPSHSICLITEAEKTENLTTLIELGNRLSENHRRLSDRLWTFENGGWVGFQIQSNSPEAYLVKRQNLIDKSRWYSEQKEYLISNFEKENIDVFVASYQAVEDDENGLLSYSVLSFGVETLLPRTDKIFIVDPAQTEEKQVLGNFLWEELVELLGQEKFIPYKDLVPPIYDFVEKLNEDDFIKIRNHLLAR